MEREIPVASVGPTEILAIARGGETVILTVAQGTTYWTDLWGLRHGKRHFEAILDVPLGTGVQRARWGSLWSVLLGAVTAALVRPLWYQTTFLRWTENWPVALAVLLWLMLCGLGAVIFYGLFRFYVVEAHVLTVNLFKVRGQRLRLLNALSATLPLSILFDLSWYVSQFNRPSGAVLAILTGGSLLIIWSASYQVIFHRKSFFQALGLWGGSTVVTGFAVAGVLFALLVAVAMASFLGAFLFRVL
ncbi:hypothetical protein D2Q93_09635 [Alicyclobacillaceae bacterium I2511]|nr:hypothetical protein D2Q93_09635 [Alicyclobacillaceae bacterium I2511]